MTVSATACNTDMSAGCTKHRHRYSCQLAKHVTAKKPTPTCQRVANIVPLLMGPSRSVGRSIAVHEPSECPLVLPIQDRACVSPGLVIRWPGHARVLDATEVRHLKVLSLEVLIPHSTMAGWDRVFLKQLVSFKKTGRFRRCDGCFCATALLAFRRSWRCSTTFLGHGVQKWQLLCARRTSK